MDLSEEGLELIKRSEGFRSLTYKDVNGFPTIGFGHKLKPGEAFSEGIDEAQATAILEADTREAQQEVSRLVKVPLTQGQFDALVDFTFNLGSGRLASSTLLRVLNFKNYAAAGEQLLRWDIAAGEVNTDLKVRREAEFALWNGTNGAVNS